MGETTADTVREIELTRARLGDEMQELQKRLPSPVAIAKRVAIVAGSAAGGTIAFLAIRRGLRQRRARPAYPAPIQRALEAVPEGWNETLTDPRAWAYGLGGVSVLLRLIELRSLGKIRRAIAA